MKNEFEIAVVNELSEFEPLKFYCIVEKKTKMMRLILPSFFCFSYFPISHASVINRKLCVFSNCFVARFIHVG